MNNSITHRGPDSEGYYCDENICLGHRRLSIIDLSEKGRQPMEYIDRYAITYNGEIYNYIELRKELEGFGFIFKTDTDTEVILIAYHKWGKDCLSRFNGMWSFCLYDKKEKIALLARDRFGIKPLYIKETDKAIYFGSEIKQLLTITPIHKVNEKVLMNYLIFGMNDISNETFFDSINILPASYYLLVDTKTGNSEIIQYYSLKINPIIREMNDNEAIVEYHNLLRDSISLRLRSDVKVGTCLSGGLDSSYVASISSDIYTLNSDAKFTGITAGSIDSTNDEKNWAEKIAINKNLDWQVTSPSKEEFLKNIEKVIEIQEEPFTTPSVFMQFFVAKKASESGCVVLLDGQGGDETLLGYERYYASFLSSIPFFLRFSSFNEIAKNSRLNLIQTILMSFYFTNHTIRKSILMWRSRYIKQQYLKLADWTFIEDMTKASKNLDSLQKFEITKSCLPHLLKYEDRNSMHFSIEARLPFIDYRVVEYAISLKHKLKIHEGWSKYVLRKGSKNILPDEIRWRKKKFGFEAPDKIWLSDSAYFKKEIDNSVILKSVFNKIPPIDNKEVLWRLYNIAKWEQIFNVTL
jgi:asparagine synthase (glutamine-hydrolysing)